MEKEDLRRSLDLLRAHGVTFDSIFTDRHPQIQKYLQEANITQYYDVWHIEKGVSKKLLRIAQKKDSEKLQKWYRSIKKPYIGQRLLLHQGQSEWQSGGQFCFCLFLNIKFNKFHFPTRNNCLL